MRRTGYLPVAQFQSIMAHAAVVLALTTREATMQRAAYEALQFGRPLVCSDTGVLRRVLADAAVFVGNSAPAIAAGIREAVARADQLQSAGAAVQAAMQADSQRGLAAVRALSGAAAGRPADLRRRGP